jgi:hypothetical protein
MVTRRWRWGGVTRTGCSAGRVRMRVASSFEARRRRPEVSPCGAVCASSYPSSPGSVLVRASAASWRRWSASRRSARTSRSASPRSTAPARRRSCSRPASPMHSARSSCARRPALSRRRRRWRPDRDGPRYPSRGYVVPMTAMFCPGRLRCHLRPPLWVDGCLYSVFRAMRRKKTMSPRGQNPAGSSRHLQPGRGRDMKLDRRPADAIVPAVADDSRRSGS